jgi:hypothetical protein
MADPAALQRLRPVIADARRTSRRIWLVMEARDVHDVSPDDISRAARPEGLNDVVMIRANQIRSELTTLYGSPDTSVTVAGRLTQFERFRAYLFAPTEETRR